MNEKFYDCVDLGSGNNVDRDNANEATNALVFLFFSNKKIRQFYKSEY